MRTSLMLDVRSGGRQPQNLLAGVGYELWLQQVRQPRQRRWRDQTGHPAPAPDHSSWNGISDSAARRDPFHA